MFGPLAGHARIWAPGRSSSHRFRWSGAGNARRRDDGALHAVIDVTPDRDHDLILELSEHELSEDAVRPNVAWRDTEQAWMRAVPAFSDSVADRDVQVAYAVLRGLTSSGGGMVAAATTSLPERAEHGRAYDYRYWWIRDQCYTGQAIAAAGGHPLVDDAVRFVSERVLADGPGLKPAYSVVGSALPCPAADVSDRPGDDGRSSAHASQDNTPTSLRPPASRITRLGRPKEHRCPRLPTSSLTDCDSGGFIASSGTPAMASSRCWARSIGPGETRN